ncbi:MAG: alanine racemase, partial [Clostridia bacterium]|nr:alanine racemase [Clostridia bacterium]
MRPTYAAINIKNLEHNIKVLKARCKNLLFVTVKANGYGHGDVIVATACEEAGADFLGVATIDEGIHLRENAIDLPILVLGGTYYLEDYSRLPLYNLSICVYNKEQLAALRAVKGVVKVHLKVDTGMGRLGISPDEVEEYLKAIDECGNLVLEGVYTHIAAADEDYGEEYTMLQFKRFEKCVETVKKSGKRPIIHFAASAATFAYGNRFNYDDEFTYMNRLGIAAYGYSYVDEGPTKLKKVMEIKSRIVHLKTIHKGDCVSYGCEFKAEKDTVVATVPIGYGDGYKRTYRKGYMIVAGQKASIIGRVCMDHTMLDVSHIEGVEVGDIVTCMGKDGDNEIWADDLAEIDGTISYEVLTS